MELWIRSQDKESIARITGVLIEEKEIRGFTETTSYYKLGEYATKERALEVLDEIQGILNPMLIFKNAELDEETLKDIRDEGVCFVSDDAKLEQLSTYVYEMPKE